MAFRIRILYAERTRLAVALEIEAEDKMDEFSLDRIDLKAFLDLGAATFRLNNAIAKRRP